MKRITAYRKLFNTDKDADLKQLKSAYRNLVKEWHPDKFQDGDVRKEEAELKSREIIDAYHFLVSIAPETHAANKEVYTETITNSGDPIQMPPIVTVRDIFSSQTLPRKNLRTENPSSQIFDE